MAEHQQLVIVAHDIGDTGGMERAFAELVRRLPATLPVTVLSTTLAPDLADRVTWHRLRGPRRPFLLKYLFFYVRAAWWLRRHRDSALVHTCGAIVPNAVDLASVHFCHAAYAAVRPSLSQDPTPMSRKLLRRAVDVVALAAERRAYRGRTRALAAVSPEVADELRRLHGHDQVVVTPNGVRLEQFARPPAARATARAALGLPDTAPVLAFVGGDWRRKRLALALDVLVAVRAKRPDTVLVVAGAGPRPAYQALADRLGVGASVRFLGRLDDPASVFWATDVMLVTSCYEAAPLAFLEAAAAGTPIVTTPVNGSALVGGLPTTRIADTVDGLAAAILDVLEGSAGDQPPGEVATAATWDVSAGSVREVYATLGLTT